MKAKGDRTDGMGVESQKVERSFEIVNKLGLHARAAAKLVRLTNTHTRQWRRSER
jgi:hypothetical protein